MNFVTPRPIASPVSGELSRPRIMKFERQGKIYEEAHWYCPTSGQFIMKGVVSVTDKQVDKTTE